MPEAIVGDIRESPCAGEYRDVAKAANGLRDSLDIRVGRDCDK